MTGFRSAFQYRADRQRGTRSKEAIARRRDNGRNRRSAAYAACSTRHHCQSGDYSGFGQDQVKMETMDEQPETSCMSHEHYCSLLYCRDLEFEYGRLLNSHQLVLRS